MKKVFYRLKTYLWRKKRNFTIRLLKTILPFTRAYVKKICFNETCFDFYISNSDAKIWYDTMGDKLYKRELEFIFNNLLEKNDIMMEIGSHQGFTGILFSKRVGENGKILCFEPNSGNFEILQKNIQLNKIQNIIAINRALGDKKGEIEITTEDSNSYIIQKSQNQSQKVDMETADSYIHYNPTFLKIDIEGAEMLALKGAQQILKTLPKLAIEIHKNLIISRYNADLKELLNLIPFEYYNCHIQYDEGEIIPLKTPEDLVSFEYTTAHLFARPVQ